MICMTLWSVCGLVTFQAKGSGADFVLLPITCSVENMSDYLLGTYYLPRTRSPLHVRSHLIFITTSINSIPISQVRKPRHITSKQGRNQTVYLQRPEATFSVCYYRSLRIIASLSWTPYAKSSAYIATLRSCRTYRTRIIVYLWQLGKLRFR